MQKPCPGLRPGTVPSSGALPGTVPAQGRDKKPSRAICVDAAKHEREAGCRCARAAGRADAGAPLRQGAQRPIGGAARGLCGAHRRSSGRHRRGAADRHSAPPRRVACDRDQDHRTAQARGSRHGAALSRGVPYRGRARARGSRARPPPPGGRRPDRAGGAGRSRRIGRRRDRAPCVGDDTARLRSFPELLRGPDIMLSNAIRKQAADILMTAARERKQAVQLSKTWPEITLEDAYAISTEVANRRIAAGAKLIGHKVGLTSKAMQRSSQIDEPDYGHLLDDMMIADGARIPHENYCRPRVEIELAFVMGKKLKGPGVGLTDVLRATEYVVPAIEIVDARVQDPRKIFDTVADNGAAAGIVVGGRPVAPLEIDLRWVGGIMYRNAEIEETGVAAGVLGHPALGVAWLANKLGAHGVTLEPGHLVLAGSFTRVVFAKKGDTLHADFGALGAIAVQFV